MSWHLGFKHQRLRTQGKIVLARSKKLITAVDILVYVVSTLSLLFTTDQVRLVWINHDASGVSVLTWTFYTLSSATWMFYGWVHKDKVILIINLLWVALQAFVVLGVVLYG